MDTFTPVYNPVAGSLALSALCGIFPLLIFFILLGVFKIKTHWCAIISLVVAVVIAIFGFKMPTTLALLSGGYGFVFGFFPILYIIIAAVWLYNLTETSGRSADVRAAFNVVGKGDQRVQGLLIAFSFCGLLEGLAGFGAPVAIVAAMLVTVGVSPIKAGIGTIVGNAINVGYGAMAIPVTTAGRIGGTEPTAVAWMMGHLTPYIASFVPIVLLFIFDGLRGVKQLWSVALVSGLTTALTHWWCASFFSYELTAVVAALLGFTATSLYLLVFKPNTPSECHSDTKTDLTPARATLALMPYWLVVIIFGVAKLWTIGINLPAVLKQTDITFNWPGLYGKLLNMDGSVANGAKFTFASLSSPGTLIILTAVIVIFSYAATSSNGLYPMSISKGFKALWQTIYNLRIAILTISVVMALAYVMNFSGQTASIGAWLAGAGAGFAFVSPILGWIGTAVAGSATSANALFANLQSTAASQVGANPALLLAANTIGGGLGKIVSPQNLAIAATAVGENDIEATLLKKVAPWSIGFLVMLCLLTGLASLGVIPGIPS